MRLVYEADNLKTGREENGKLSLLGRGLLEVLELRLGVSLDGILSDEEMRSQHL